MSLIKLDRIVSFSSQDERHKAEHLLRNGDDSQDTKWLGANDQESKQVVTIELSEPSEMHQINIHNESSAFIEVRVGNKDQLAEDYEVLLPACSFMSPNESKSGTNRNRLKIFTSDDSLAKQVASKKWQLVQLVCTQPFNKLSQFGVGNIKLFNQIVLSDENKEALKIITGMFGLKKTLSSDTSAPVPSAPKLAFQKAYITLDDEAGKGSTTAKKTADAAPAQKGQAPGADDCVDGEHCENKITSKKADAAQQPTPSAAQPSTMTTTTAKQQQPKPSTATATASASTSSASAAAAPAKINIFGKGKTPAETPGNAKPNRPEQILKGVIFALSGFQNPLRSELRDKGMKLGAKYRPDWTDDCTHLICAFPNTPKANLVKSQGGIIVEKEWLLDSERQRRVLNTTDYHLDDGNDSDDSAKPRKAARNANKKITNLRKRGDDDDNDDDDEDDFENSDDKDFIVDSSDEDDDIKSESEDEEEEEDDDDDDSDSDDSENARSSKSKKKRAKKERKDKSKSKRSDKKRKSTDSKEEKKKAKKKPKTDDAKESATTKTKAKSSSSKGSKKRSDSSSSSSGESDADSELAAMLAYKKKKERELAMKTSKQQQQQVATKKKNEDDEEDNGVTSKHEKNGTAKTSVNTTKKKGGIKYDGDGDDDDDDDNQKESKKTAAAKDEDGDESETDWHLPSFFQDKHFYIYGDFGARTRQNLARIVVAYSGTLHEYASDEIDYVVTDKEWNDEFEQSKKDHPTQVVVSADWLMACNKRQRLIAYQPFQITP